MNNKFLHYIQQKSTELGLLNANPIFVFPTKNAGNEFGLLANYPFENITTINDLMLKISGLEQVDEMELLIKLFVIYKKRFPDSDFSSFEGWGKIMLQDFDLIDKYLQEPKRFFRQLSEIKSIEDITPLDEDAPLLFNFTKKIKEQSGIFSGFLSTWEFYEQAYFELQEELLNNQIGWEGLIYRAANDRLLELENINIPNYIFCGFNALTSSESKFLKYLTSIGKAEVFWDTDEWYITNTKNNTGTYIREAIRDIEYPGFQNKLNHIESSELNMKFYEFNYTYPQFREVFQILGTEDFNCNETAIILCNEDLLIPFKQEAKKYPLAINYRLYEKLSHQPIYSVIKDVFNLIRSFNPENSSFPSSELYKFSQSRWIKEFDFVKPISFSEMKDDEGNLVTGIVSLSTSIKELKTIYKNQNTEVLLGLLSNQEENYLLFLNCILDVCKRKLIFQTTLDAFELAIEKFKILQAEIKSDLISNSLEKELFNILDKIKIFPMDSDKNQEGIEVLGLLESRCLDFENLIIIGANQGVLPKKQTFSSYIPEDLKYRNGIPRRKSNENIEGYYFWRLIQHAKNVHITYVNNPDEGKVASQYLLQYQYLIKEVKVKEEISNINLLNKWNKKISFPKDKEFMDVVMKLVDSGFSASMLTKYLECPLRFYFSNVKQLDKIDNYLILGDDLETNAIGLVIHSVMFEFYKSFNDKEKITYDSLSSKWESTKDKLIEKICSKEIINYEEIKSLNSLELETISILLEQLIGDDLERIKNSQNKFVEILGLELNLKYDLLLSFYSSVPTCKIKGIIDRVQLLDGVIEIVDYKTGRINNSYSENQEFIYPDVSPFIDKSYFKEKIQLGIYHLLYSENYKPVTIPIKELLYAYRKNDFQPNIPQGFSEVENVDLAQMNLIENFSLKLATTIEQILDPTTPIRQTHHPKHCTYCNFNHICKLEGNEE